MNKLLAFGAFVFLLASCTGAKTTMGGAPPEKEYTVEYLAKNTSEKKLQKNYPDLTLEEDTGVFEEGTVEREYTVLYPGTEKEIHLIWKDKAKGELYQIVFSEAGNWKSASGIGIGSTYDELVALNKKPIQVYGFGWDYSGAVDWNEGKLAKSKLRVFLKPSQEPDPKFYGDGIISPSEEELKDLDLRVGSIIYQVENE